ncbi:hypothetical protein HA051_08150 [Chromobacterium vaccinii]|nr:hypothetical protein [Chromobacterium vaccinii]
MRRVGDNRNPVRDKFGAGKHGFGPGDPQTGQPATTPGYELFDSWQEELANIIESAGMQLDASNNRQLAKAIETQSAKLFGPLNASLAGSNGSVADANSASAGLSYFDSNASNFPAPGPGVLFATAPQNGIALQYCNTTSGIFAFRFYTVKTMTWSAWTKLPNVSQVESAFTPINSSTAGSNGSVGDANSASTGLSYFDSNASNVPAAGPGVLFTTAPQNGIALQYCNTTSGAFAFRFYTAKTMVWSAWATLPGLDASNVFSKPQSVGLATAPAHAVRLDQFSGLFSNGTFALPGGNIIKIGTAVGSSAESANVTFMPAFPNYCQAVIAMPLMGQAYFPSATNKTRTGFMLDVWGAYSTAALGVRGAATVMYIAFGG